MARERAGQHKEERQKRQAKGRQTLPRSGVLTRLVGETIPTALSASWQQLLLRHNQRLVGNGATAARLPRQQAPASLIQRENGGGGGGGNAGGGAARPAPTEQPYTVTGATLDEVSPQLNHFEGQYAALTQTDLGISSQIQPEQLEDGTFRATVPWAINGVTVNLPQWDEYGSACAAAQGEWDRFMTQTRQHEQTAHVDAAYDFVDNLPETDRIITGATREELVQNIQAKHQELAGTLQGIHDGCDHGVSIDAILHPDNGRCEEEGSAEESVIE